MGKVTLKELTYWKEQIVQEQLAWAQDVKGIKDPELLGAYEAGLRKGMAEMFGTLDLQCRVKLRVP